MYAKKVIELGNLPNIKLSDSRFGIRKVDVLEDRLCIISENLLNFFTLSRNHENARLISSWTVEYKGEFILDGRLIDFGLFIVLTNLSIYLLVLDNESITEAKAVRHEYTQFIDNSQIILADNIFIRKNGLKCINVVVSCSSGFFLVSVEQLKSEYCIRVGSIISTQKKGIIIPIEDEIILVDSSKIQKFHIYDDISKCLVVDSLPIGEIISKSIGECNIEVICNYKDVNNNVINVVFLTISDRLKFNGIEITISSTNLTPIQTKLFKVNDLDQLISVFQAKSSDNMLVKMVTYDFGVIIYEVDDFFSETCLACYNNINKTFTPFVSKNPNNTNILYAGCTFEEETDKLCINIIEKESNSNIVIRNISNFDDFDYQIDKPADLSLQEILNGRIDGFLPLSTVISLFKKFISISEESDYHLIFEYIEKIPLHNIEDTITLYSSIISALEAVNSDKINIMRMNYLTQKSITFDFIYKNNDRKLEVALGACLENNSNEMEMETSWNILSKKFSRCDLGKLCNCLLSLNLIDEFFFLFNRHYIHFGNGDETSRSEAILELLENIPVNLPDEIEKEIPSWLVNQVFPFVIDKDKLLNWIADRTITLEHISNGDIDRCIFLLSSIFVNEYSDLNNQILPKQIVSNGIFWAGSGDKRNSICKTLTNKINQVYWALLECKDLKNKYKLEIGFSSIYNKKISSRDIAYTLLSRISSSELLNYEIKNNVIPFCRLRGLDTDQIILEYLIDLISSINYDMLENNTYTVNNRTYYQPRIISLINSISDDEYRAYALLQYLSLSNKLFTTDHDGNFKFSTRSEMDYLMSYARSLSLDSRNSSELKNRIALLDAQNLLSRYNLDNMASIILFEKNAPRRLIMHVISQVDTGIESFKDAMFLIEYLKREANTYFMSISEAFCVRLRFLIFKRTSVVEWEKINRKSIIEIRYTILEEEISDMLSIVDCKNICRVTQQFVCFVWQFLDYYSPSCNRSHKLRVKCEIATYSAIVALRELFKSSQDNKLEIRQRTFWISKELFNTLIRLQQLQFEFGIFLRPSDLMVDKMDHDKECLLEREGETNNVYLDPYQAKNTLSNPFGMSEAVANKEIYKENINPEWKNGYLQIYKESCYERMCEIFDTYAQPIIELSNSNGVKTGVFTKLLRLGCLIGVDESYVRRTMIRHSIREGGKMCIFKRLAQELYKTPSPKNAMTIVDEVQNIILNLRTVNEFHGNNEIRENYKVTHINGPGLLFIFSKLLQVVATCIPYFPVRLISFILALSSDILWALDFLVHASDAVYQLEDLGESFISDLNDDHIFSKVIVSSLTNLNYISMDSNRSYYKEICTLYPFIDAKKTTIKFLSYKIRICKEISKQISADKIYISPFITYNLWTDSVLWTIQNDGNMSINSTKYIQGLRESIDTLAKQLYQFECLSLAMSICLKHPLLISDMKLVLNINTEFFRKVLNGRDPMDGQLCMALSSTLEKKDSWNVFVQSLNPSNILDKYYRAQRMARIGWDLGILFNHYSMRKEMEDLHKQSKWCNRFRELRIDFDQSLFFQKQDSQINIEYKKSIIHKLIKNSNFDLIICLQYAKDYNINDEYVLFLWSKQMILYYFDPKFELKMQNILSFITPELGGKIFENTFELISSFDYERLIFVLNWRNQNCSYATAFSSSKEISSKKDHMHGYSTSSSFTDGNIGSNESKVATMVSVASKLEILKLLSSHKRFCSADFSEKEFIRCEIEKISTTYEPLENMDHRLKSRIQSRIPFHYLIKNPIDALKYEINDETIYKIKRISQYLGIQMITIDIQFVWNIVLSRKIKCLLENNQLEKDSGVVQEYCLKLVENDKVLLRYIESIASFDLESGIAVALLIIDELPLSIAKIKLIEWCESKLGKIDEVSLKKGYPAISTKFMESNKYNESILDIGSYLKSKKSLISSTLILKKYGLDKVFSKLIEETNDISILINSLYYYLTPLISEGPYWKFKNKLQETVCQSFCIQYQKEREAIAADIKNHSIVKSTELSPNFNLSKRFNLFIDEISYVYLSDIRKIRMRVIKNLLCKPFETPYEAIKNRLPNNMRQIFVDIENSGLVEGLDKWYKKKTFCSKHYNTYIDRVSFICGGIPLNDAILLLLSISFKDSVSNSYSTKCNALRTLFQIASIKSIQKRYPKYDDLQVIWLHNYYMIYFNDLHIPQDFSKFYLSEKVGLARSLWREYNSRRISIEPVKSNHYFERNEGVGEVGFSNRKKKMRCVANKENEYTNTIASKPHFQNLDAKLNNILYLITKLCLDFEIFDSTLFSNTIKNLYLQIFDINDIRIFCDLICTSYTNGYIYNIPINKSIIDVWNILVIDPISVLKNSIDSISDLIIKYGSNNTEIKECVYDNLFLNLPNIRYIIPMLAKVYNKCPITPFIKIEELLNSLFDLLNSIIDLKEIVSKQIMCHNIKTGSYNRLISHVISFLTTLAIDISEDNTINCVKRRYTIPSFEHDNSPCASEVSSIFDIIIIELMYSYISPIDLHYTLFSKNREKMINQITEKESNYKLLPYMIYSTSSKLLVSALSLELIKRDNSQLFFDTGRILKDLVHLRREPQIEEIFVAESIKANKVYEFICCKYNETYNAESVKIIKRCIEFYKIETVIPYIVKFLSGEVKSESEIIDQINQLENNGLNSHEQRCDNPTEQEI
ncbi:hypothetical protein OJ252_2096 [Cryptosporidium canis]|uniref:KNTC1 third ARM-repeats domain-containing protein n=1 Tax=Cryptosporidium canis TaxID=195482 RepID=A0ABQ8P6K1_9CRYT|nr:hypothetical protein OJ252_2096 [Cryptosporidium canis]